MTDRIRTTISLPPEVHEIFKQMAELGGMSVSRCMGDWLTDTAEGAQFVMQKMVEAKQAPKTVMREMQAMSRGLVEEVDKVMEGLRQRQVDARSGPPAAAGAPSSNTGLKSPQKGKPTGAKGSEKGKKS